MSSPPVMDAPAHKAPCVGGRLLALVGLAVIAAIAACNPSRFPNPNGLAQDQAGFSVGIDSTFAIVGVPRSDTLQPNGGKALIYRSTDDGYLLYSVGVNGVDDKGRTADDEPPGDDLVVRMPQAKK